jgi:O-antigen/teichoic acid export membrane protein
MEELDIAQIRKRSVHGILALTSRTFLLNIISFAAFVTISTQLPTKDFGLYTAVIAIQRVISFFSDVGLGAALIQKKESLTKEDLATSFTIQAAITFLLFLMTVLLRHQILQFFHLTEEALRLLIVLVFTIFLASFKVIPSILLERKIQFHRLIIPQIIESLAFNGILIAALFSGMGLDSFTYAFLISSIVSVPAYYYVSPWVISFQLQKEALQHLKYGSQFQAKNILATIKDDLLTVILTKFLSYTQIGYIGFAQRLSFFFYRYIVDSVTKVTFATYSRLQDSQELLEKTIEKSLFFVSVTMFPLLTGLIVTAPFLIAYFPKWQGKWEPALVSIVFFALNAMVSALSGILVNVLDANGKVRTTLKLMTIWTTMTWILTPILIMFFGYNGVAIASFVVTLTIFYTILLVKQIVSFHFLQSVWKPFFSSMIMGVSVYGLSLYFVTDFLSLLFIVILGMVVYTGCLYLLAGKEILQDIASIRRRA